MDDTTTLIFKRLDKVDTIAEDVATIKGQMPNLATKDHVAIKIAEHAAAKKSFPPMSNGSAKKIAALSGVIVALAGAIVYLVKLVIF